MRITDIYIDAVFKALLGWYVEAGVDETILNRPINRTRIAVNSAQRSEKKHTAVSYSLTRDLLQPASKAGEINFDLNGAVEAARRAANRAASLDALNVAVERFDYCNLKLTANNTVFADGIPGAEVMIIGEAPGADEDHQGKPFVGVSGRLLDSMLDSIGLSRFKSVYITNIIPWHPPGNRQPTSDEISVCIPFVERHIELAAPRILMLVGGTSVRALMKIHDGIARLRGNFMNWTSPNYQETIPALATYHPAYLLRTPSQKASAWNDMLTLRCRLDSIANKF
ncbi:uracil-DNA glycosylase, 4 family protein [Candidatus Endolissoclinum faulkneri L2]|uniref:Type-4 uracil-DNA glycosylase n=1 Tax=Candidatus Endolissoclinum faulkneri L2 TaxID=1193729 RepID=K7YPM8_9PROT|nr:uracil-DNA glycosylase [Candidatus Endolissoclinum faulkneri]AFX98524.1 uracil-DNA glycosylase, 4 family protein [Candidatus Endolissoclinum faulkneri L2]